MNSTPTNSLDLSHVSVWSISNQWFSIPIKVETVENTEEITTLVDCGAEGLFIDKSIAHKWRKSIFRPLKSSWVRLLTQIGNNCNRNWLHSIPSLRAAQLNCMQPVVCSSVECKSQSQPVVKELVVVSCNWFLDRWEGSHTCYQIKWGLVLSLWTCHYYRIKYLVM